MTLPSTPPVGLTEKQLHSLLSLACQAADAASVLTTRYFRSEMCVDNKAEAGNFDPVTMADREAELAIREVLLKQRPDIGFYGEEHENVASKTGLTWVVDPIDGTRAYMSGMPLWGTLIGLYDGNDAVLGVMDQPILKERYTGYGACSFFAGAHGQKRLATRNTSSVTDAVAYCTTPDMFTDHNARLGFENLRDSVKMMRYGGDCYAYALLAAGYVDIVIDCDLQPYDIQALIPIIRGAGGVVSTWSDQSAVNGGYVVACGTRELHRSVLPVLLNQ